MRRLSTITACGLLGLSIAACAPEPMEGSGATELGTGGDTETDTEASATTSTTAPTTSSTSVGPTGTGTMGSMSTSGPGVDCGGAEILRLDATEAALSGGWTLGFANPLDKDVARYDGDEENPPPDNAVVFSPEIPCAGDWYVWVHFRDVDRYDSFFVQIDGLPATPVVFDGDCDFNNNPRWRWNDLRWRNENDEVCDFAEDPWVQSWDAGGHEVRFSFRESDQLSEIVLTTDPNYQP